MNYKDRLKRLRRNNEWVENTPLQTSEHGTYGYEGTNFQRSTDHWLQKSMGEKMPPLDVFPKMKMRKTRRT